MVKAEKAGGSLSCYKWNKSCTTMVLCYCTAILISQSRIEMNGPVLVVWLSDILLLQCEQNKRSGWGNNAEGCCCIEDDTL